jgi:cyanate permease
MLASLLFGLYSSNLWAITQTIAGPAASGKWTGMQNGFGNLAGVVAPALTGWVVEETGSFKIAFIVVAAMLVIGACAFRFIVGPVKPIIWSNAELRVSSPESV